MWSCHQNFYLTCCASFSKIVQNLRFSPRFTQNFFPILSVMTRKNLTNLFYCEVIFVPGLFKKKNILMNFRIAVKRSRLWKFLLIIFIKKKKTTFQKNTFANFSNFFFKLSFIIFIRVAIIWVVLRLNFSYLVNA